MSEGAKAITAAVGARPVGFRAPGYTLSDELVEVLEEQGFDYDSSVFPCPAYQAAKGFTKAIMRARGHQSTTITDRPQVLGAPADPYRVGRPYWRAGEGIAELPIGVTRGLSGRLPYIGTSLILAGRRGAAALTRMIVGRPFVNLELHGIDLADRALDGLGFLRTSQPDLRIGLESKRQILEASIHRLKLEGYSFVTLSDAASEVVRR